MGLVNVMSARQKKAILGIFISWPEDIVRLLLSGGGTSLTASIIGICLGLLTNLFFARLLGVVIFGHYAIAIGWATLLAIPLTFGTDFVILRFVPVYIRRRAPENISRLLQLVAEIIICLAIVAYAILVVTDFAFPGTFGIAGASNTALIALLATSTAGLTVCSALFRAAKLIFFSQFYLQIARSLLILLGIWGLSHLPIVTPERALLVTTLSASVALLMTTIHLARRKNMFTMSAPNEVQLLGDGEVEERQSWIKMAWPCALAAIVQQALSQSGVIALGLFSTSEQASLYTVASRLAVLATFPLSALGSITAPMIVEAWADNERERLQAILTLNARLSFAGAVIVVIGYFIFSHRLLGLFGGGFSNARSPLIILCLGNLVVAYTGACAFALVLSGNERYFFKTMCGGLAVLVSAFAVSWITGSGAIGVACSVAVALTFTNVAQSTYVRKLLGVSATAW